MTLLITGANGVVSSALLRSLPTGGIEVRALVRDLAKAPQLPGVKVVIGDLDDPSSLPPAFAGVDTVWLLTAMGPQAPHQSMNAVWAARQAGVRHIVRMSAIGAGYDAPTRNGRLHALSDAELMASGIGWTIVRPAFFTQNLLGAVVGGVLYGATGEGRVGMIDARDIADFGARVLTDPARHAGKTYTLTGPASISLRQVAADLQQVLGTSIAYQPISADQAFTAMRQAGLPEWTAAVNAEYATAYASGWGDYTTPDFAIVVGRPARDLATFARDHADQLRGT
jgi:uncharacterized protein YbjT (DUF2867 family)